MRIDPDNLTALQVFDLARSIACKHFPYYASAIYNLIPVETRDQPTMAVTEKAVCFYHPDFLVKIGPKFTAGVIVHEIGHLIRGHHKRFRNLRVPKAQWELWQIAIDCELNSDHPSQLPLPEGCIYPEQFGMPPKKTAEMYFAMLLQQQKQRQQEQQGQQQGQQGQPGEHDHGPGSGHCGSCSGPPKEGEQNEKYKGLGRSQTDLNRIRDQVARDIIEHQKRWGRGSQDLLWWAEKRLKPPLVRWQQQLVSLTRQAVAFREGFVDYRNDLPHQQQGVLGWGPNVPLMPRLIAPIPEVMFLVDRSMSMQFIELNAVAQEVPGVLSAVNAPILFGSFDDQVKEIKRVASLDAALKLFKGGGGTNFHPIFEALKKQKKRPNVLIIGTDGCGPAPAVAPKGVSVIWLLVGQHAQRPIGPNGPISWGKFIYTDPGLREKAIAA